MTELALASTVLILAVLGVLAFGPELAAAVRRRLGGRGSAALRRSVATWDPGRELRAERRARELLREVISGDEFAMYEELGFLQVAGDGRDDSGYGYLLYPHRPIVAYDTRTGELLNEYCVAFPDRSEPENGSRLPDADDLLAKWMTLHGGERDLIDVANMHVPGRQLDPAQVRRDLLRLREWRAVRARASA
jgi:hypothetical protein